jgi:hypothetical protein
MNRHDAKENKGHEIMGQDPLLGLSLVILLFFHGVMASWRLNVFDLPLAY